MRPLKLLEVTKKAVMSVVKRRMGAELEAAGVLSNRQCGFRPGYNCHIAALRLMAMLEGARRDKADCEVVALDISKAYDTVERGWGLGVALERLGVAGRVTEWLWAGSRDNVNWVRTGWEELLSERGETIPTFHARTGFTQGAAESPLLWNVFFDMLLCQLEREGVGAEMVWSATAEGEGEGEGLGAFADDTVLVARSRESAEAALASVQAVFSLVGLRVAAHKSVHMGLRWVQGEGGSGVAMQMAEEDEVGVSMDGVRVPQVDHDVGFRYLGVWLDGAGDWGEESARIKDIISSFCCTVEQLRVPAGVVLYLYKAVLTPRVMYKLALASLSGGEIDELEDSAWQRLARRLGGWANMDKRLMRMPGEDGGLGLTPWSAQAVERRVGLITQLYSHREGWALALAEELRVGWVRDRSGSGRPTLGAEPSAATNRLEEASETSSWMRGTDALLNHLKLSWCPWVPAGGDGWRYHDCEVGSLGLVLTKNQASALAAAPMCWLSDLCSWGGSVVEWAQVPGWQFLAPLVKAARKRREEQPLGEWRGRANIAGGARPGCWVVRGNNLGWLRCWRKVASGWEGGVVWAPGAWQGAKGVWRVWKGTLALQGRWPCGEDAVEWMAAGSLRRRWGLRANPNVQSFSLEVWVRAEEAVEAAGGIGGAMGAADTHGTPYSGVWTEGSEEGLRQAVLEAGQQGLPLIIASDGSVRQSVADPAVGPTSVSAAGWAIGVSRTADEQGLGVNQVRWIAAGGQRVQAAVVTQSSYRAEVAGAVMAGRVLLKAGSGSAVRPTIHHWCDNQGVVAAWERRSMIKAGAQRAGPAAAGRAELDALRAQWGEREKWSMSWVAAHPERDTERPASEWCDAERANVRADAAAEAAHGSTAAFLWDEQSRLRVGGGEWSLSEGPSMEAPAPRVAWQRRSRQIGLEYARERLEQAGLSRMGWATAIWAGAKVRDWGEWTFRTRLWWGHLLPYKARHTGQCDLCGEAVEGMQWHILARCQHTRLLEARLEAADAVRERFVSMVRELSLPADLQAEVYSQLGGRLDRWVAIEGERAVGGVLSRYGKFSAEWLERWWEGARDGGVVAWRKGMKAWRTVAALQTEACGKIWRAATGEYWEKKRAQTLAARAGQRQQVRRQRSAEELALCMRRDLDLFQRMLRVVRPQGWSQWDDSAVVAWGRERRAKLQREEWERGQRQNSAVGSGSSGVRPRRKRGAVRKAAAVDTLHITDFFGRLGVATMHREDG
jgi:hypothetical protein